MPESRSRLAGLSAMVLEMTVTVVVGAFAGGWLDRKLGTAPLMLTLASLAGFAAGMTRLILTANRLLRPDDDVPPDEDRP